MIGGTKEHPEDINLQGIGTKYSWKAEMPIKYIKINFNSSPREAGPIKL